MNASNNAPPDIRLLTLLAFVLAVVWLTLRGGSVDTEPVASVVPTEPRAAVPVASSDQGVPLLWWSEEDAEETWRVEPSLPGSLQRVADIKAGLPEWILSSHGAFFEATDRPLSEGGFADMDPNSARGRWLQDLEISVGRFGVDWVYPIRSNLKAGSPYGRRKNPITHQWQTHKGHDIGCRMGEPIYAVSDGIVTRSGRGSGTGNVVIVEHLDGDPVKLETRYLHLLDRYVRTGDEVGRGQPLGRCGSTGRSTSPHLHFEVLVDGEAEPPLWPWPTAPDDIEPLLTESRATVVGRSMERVDRVWWNRFAFEGEVPGPWRRGLGGRGEVWVYAPTAYPDRILVALGDWNAAGTGRAEFGNLVEWAREHNVALAVPSMGTSVYATTLYEETSPGFRWCGYDCEIAGLPWLGEIVIPMLETQRPVMGVVGVGMGAKGSVLVVQRYDVSAACALSGPYTQSLLTPETVSRVAHREVYGTLEEWPHRWEIDDPIVAAGTTPQRGQKRLRVLHGSNDQEVPVDVAQGLAGVLRQVGWDVDMQVVDGGGTGWPLWSAHLEDCVESIRSGR